MSQAVEDFIVQRFAAINQCAPHIAKSAYEHAKKTVNPNQDITLKAEAIKRRVALLIMYFRAYIANRRLFNTLSETRLNDIMEHINKVINESPVENTYDETLKILLELPSPQTGGKRTRKWTMKYKRSINCKSPRGFSQRQYCKYGRRKTAKK
jgi:hypothetical protein